MRTRPIVLLLLLLVTACGGASGDDEEADGGSDGGPGEGTSVDAGDPGTQNAAWYYQRITPESDLSGFGDPMLVVVNPQDPTIAIPKIHEIGAEAYQYVQFYWAGDDKPYEGIDFQAHPDWAFCGADGTPLLGRTTGEGGAVRWYFIDANERAVRQAVAQRLAEIKADGWDGVFFDRGWAATQTGQDAAGHDVWSAASTCTDDPVRPGATFADAYVDVVSLGHAAGLKVLLNTGESPYDPKIELRPDPANPACRARDWPNCPTLDDVYPHVDWMADEAVAHPQDVLWQEDFEANRRGEEEGDVIGLITSGTLGGNEFQNRDNVYFQWARVKLFDIPLAVNTGDNRCVGAPPDAVCNRFGIYPELVGSRLGPPVSDAPASTSCDAGSAIRCVWTRTYERGVMVLNASPAPKQVTVPLGVDGCRHVFDLHARAATGADCVESVTLDLPPWSGRPLLHRVEPW